MANRAEVFINIPLKMSFTYAIGDKIDVEVGERVKVPFSNREVMGFVVKTFDSDTKETNLSYEIKEIKRVVDKEPLFGKNEIALSLWMEKFYLCSRGEALSTMIPSGKKDSQLPAFYAEDLDVLKKDIELSEEQKIAVDKILNGSKKQYYLYGVTGSGKTEVFLKVAEAIIKKGKSVIYLVPEITLTHQLSEIVLQRFEGEVAILHSSLSPSQRITQWRRIRKGEVKMVIGARSAVFAPFENLGAIIIDEEHENSYKSGSTPRYHARQIAQKRVSMQSAILIMGSATPSMESYHQFQGTELEKITLKKRVAGGVLPKIEVVDMLGVKGIFSYKLQEELMRVLENKKQAILFLNRRGFSHNFHCNSCGYEMKCPNCSVALTYHRSSNSMICHYCGYQAPKPEVCPTCNSLDCSFSSFGTELIEKTVNSLFPNARVARLDTDVVAKKNVTGEIISSFKEGKYDILLGTQMVAKGLNFPKVELVGVVLADSSLDIPDFRSGERTFSLLQQVSGRAGRYDGNGKVIIQTRQKTAPAISFAVKGDLEGFYKQELEIRKITQFPPYTRLVNIVIRGRDQKKVENCCKSLAEVFDCSIESLEKTGRFKAKVVSSGANECPIDRIANNYRWQILLKSNDPKMLHILVGKVLENQPKISGVYIEVDFDPLSLL